MDTPLWAGKKGGHMVTDRTLDNPGRTYGMVSLSTLIHVGLIAGLVAVPLAQVHLQMSGGTQHAEVEFTQGDSVAATSSFMPAALQEKKAIKTLPAPVRDERAYEASRPPMFVNTQMATPIETAPTGTVPVETATAFPYQTSVPVYSQPATPAPTQDAQVSSKMEAAPTTTLPAKETSSAAAIPAGGAGEGLSSLSSAPTDVQDIDDVRQAPGNQPPSYPMNDRVQRREGAVAVVAYVGADGNVMEAAVEESSGSKDMNRVALDAVKAYKFQPGQKAFWVRVPFQFALKGEATEQVPALRR